MMSSHSPVSFQLNDVITFTAMWSKIIKQEVKLSSVVCPFEGFKSMGVKAIKTQEVFYILEIVFI